MAIVLEEAWNLNIGCAVAFLRGAQTNGPLSITHNCIPPSSLSWGTYVSSLLGGGAHQLERHDKRNIRINLLILRDEASERPPIRGSSLLSGKACTGSGALAGE